MLTEPRCVYALVRSLTDLTRTCEDIADFLSVLRRQRQPFMPETLLGIWVDAQGVANMSCALELDESGGTRQTAHILEATGVSGIWMLCWLEVPARAVSRADLLGALLEASGHGQGDSPPSCFIPVFASDEEAGNTEVEMQLLKSRYPSLLLAPLYQDPGTGRLDSLPVCPLRPG